MSYPVSSLLHAFVGGGFGGKKESGQLRFGGRDRPFKEPMLVKNQLYTKSQFYLTFLSPRILGSRHLGGRGREGGWEHDRRRREEKRRDSKSRTFRSRGPSTSHS